MPLPIFVLPRLYISASNILKLIACLPGQSPGTGKLFAQTFTLMKYLVLLLTLFFSLESMAQGGSISGKITDSSKAVKGLATVTVFRAKDTTIVTYRLSNPDGMFKVPGLPLDVPLRVMVTYSGYDAFRKDFTLTAAAKDLVLDSVVLEASGKTLDDVVVFAERPPVVIKQDTIEFNASAFKTLPNALVEDLLKKLPGVYVDKDGNIAVNGKPVNRILVDGKTFFGENPTMATRNLPANVIDKVQVVDDKEELLRNGDGNLNNVGKVVNITLKKGVKKGMFGRIYAGGGTGNRFEAGGIANIYRDTFQVSVLGYANNLNKPGFGYSELLNAGGFNRSRSNAISSSTSIWSNGSGSGISINGINFGGSQNYGGISTSRGGGININHAPNEKRSLFAQYFFGNIHVDRLTETDSKQYNQDTIVQNQTSLTGDVVTHAHNIGVGAKLKPDTLTNILINANYTVGLQDEDRISNITSDHNKLGALSRGNIIQDNVAETYYYRHAFSMTRLSATKKGRRWSFSHGLDINNRFNDYTTNSETIVMYPIKDTNLLSQLRKDRIPRTDAYAGIVQNEPLNKIFAIRSNARYEYGRSINNVETFNQNHDGKYEIFNPTLSNRFTRESHRVNVSTGLEIKWKDLSVVPTIRGLWQKFDNRLITLNMPIKQEQFDLLPALTFNYKKLSINYDRGVVLPAYNYLIAVTDNTNPYFISKGNPDLLPAVRDNVSVNFYVGNPKKNSGFGGSGGATFSKNDVVQSVTLDNNGVQTSVPVNANGSQNFWINYNINKQYKNNPKFIVSWNTGNYSQYTRSRLIFNNVNSWQATVNFNQWAGLNLNWNDRFEWNTSYSLGYNFTRYNSPAFKNLEVINHGWENEFILRLPKHFIWETNFMYGYNGGIPAGLPKNVIRWNAAVNYMMFKNEQGVLKLSVFDILKRNNSINMFTNRNMITTTRNNVLAQYFMATFTYNIRPAVKKKVGGERLFLF